MYIYFFLQTLKHIYYMCTLFSTCKLLLSDKLVLIPYLASQSIHSVPVFVLNILHEPHVTTHHNAVSLLVMSFLFSCPALPSCSILLKSFSMCFSVGMHLYWPSSTVEPASSQALWYFLCSVSWLQSREWTSVR